ncbi:putative O-methyltransferase [Annulohypoxylon truncatum]|uniref:putative O-methyltransferase n=1 Tax=Annulohypoxylon truncatum TaxID=327061 RepID=UPI00200883DE|nr:putative O-methyltransferase [Annulohypoxylon truncatum]KAI1212023.1 putative O-methyltransferase [Annulohypoxylon truncatum]
MKDSQILELSVRIATNTARVNDYLSANNLPQPSFDVNAPLQFVISPSEPEVAAAHQAVLHDCRELRDLMLGPREYLTSFQHNELIGQQVVTRFKLADAVPIGGEITFAELAATTGLHEVHLRKILRLAIAQHIFTEPRPGVVAHSAASRLIAENKVLADWLRYSSDDLWHAAYHMSDAMAKYPGSEEPGETAFALSNKTDKDMFRFFAENPERSLRFAAAMRFFTQRPGLEPERVVNGYPWEKIGGDGSGTVVDVGGSHGKISIALARRFPSLNFIVQDLDEPVVRDAERQRPEEVANRVRYMVHDFFTEQPVKGADVYFFRAVLHNWSDTYATKILQALIPALKPGAKIILNEPVVPEPDKIPAGNAARVRANDLVMLELFNGGDREMAAFKELFAKAHHGFQFHGASQPPGSNMWILEAEWMGE